MSTIKYEFVSDREFRRNVDSATRQVLRLLAKGKDTAEIADATGFSMSSVRTIKGNATRGRYEPNCVAYEG